jgi:quercetin dioxygenase-like cupin family protein
MMHLLAPTVVHGDSQGLEQAILSMLPETGSVEVQRDTPGREHLPHLHPTPETLLIVEGSITFYWSDESAECGPGDRLLLPSGTLHGSVAGEKGCLYVIATREVVQV